MRSLGYRLMETTVRLTGYKRLFSLDAEGLNDQIEKTRSKRKTVPPRFIFRRHQTRELTICGRPCYIVAPADGGQATIAVLFLHGGGMFMEATAFHWIVVSKLVKRLGAAVWVPAYPLVPGCTFRDATEMLLAVYREMLEEHPAEGITFLGDSAGAALSFMLCHHNKASAGRLPMPRKLILVSPGMVTGTDPELRKEMNRILPHDPMLGTGFMDAMTEIMRLSQDQNDYFSAPFYGDFTGFPPVHIFSGTYEIFYAQIPALVERIKAAGIPVSLYAGEKMMHVWPYVPFSQECKEALNQIFHIIETEDRHTPSKYER